MRPMIEHRRAAQYRDMSPAAAPAVSVTTGKNGPTFAGYVLKWDTIADIGDFKETVRKGAFAKALASGINLFMVLDHDRTVNNVLGSTGRGTLQLKEDDVGLAFMCLAPDSQTARDAQAVVNANKMGVSFAFTTAQQGQRFSQTQDGSRLRIISEFATLEDISLVVDPAYLSSEVSVIADGQRQAPRGVDYLRAAFDLEQLEMDGRIQEHRAAIIDPASVPDPDAAGDAMSPRDEDGKYHDGSPASTLLAAVGRAGKAEARHGTACDDYRTAAAIYDDPNNTAVLSSQLAWTEAREKHRQAIAEVRMAATNFVAVHEAKFNSPGYANPGEIAQAEQAPAM